MTIKTLATAATIFATAIAVILIATAIVVSFVRSADAANCVTKAGWYVPYKCTATGQRTRSGKIIMVCC